MDNRFMKGNTRAAMIVPIFNSLQMVYNNVCTVYDIEIKKLLVHCKLNNMDDFPFQNIGRKLIHIKFALRYW